MSDAQLLVDLLNTRDLRTYREAANVLERDRLGSPGAARRWLVDRGLLGSDREVDEEEWHLTLGLREGIREAIGSDGGRWATVFDHPVICLGVRMRATDVPVLEPAGDGVGAALGRILAAAVVAGFDGTWERVKTCAAEDCRRAFYDRSKNRSARWCSSQVCGNRVRTRSYRHRRTQGEVPDTLAWTPTRRSARARENVFRLEGEIWRITYAGQSFQLRDSKGLRQLASLLAEPGREWHVLDLVARETGADPDVRDHGTGDLPQTRRGGDAGPLLDPRAKDAYRLRVEDLRDDIEEGLAWGDAERVARAEEELGAIAAELSRSVGLGGRDRRAASEAERARVNVTRTIRSVLLRIDQHSAELGHHLASTVRTGAFCVYDPDPRLPVAWRL